jgi:hypothetical protein
MNENPTPKPPDIFMAVSAKRISFPSDTVSLGGLECPSPVWISHVFIYYKPLMLSLDLCTKIKRVTNLLPAIYRYPFTQSTRIQYLKLGHMDWSLNEDWGGDYRKLIVWYRPETVWGKWEKSHLGGDKIKYSKIPFFWW